MLLAIVGELDLKFFTMESRPYMQGNLIQCTWEISVYFSQSFLSATGHNSVHVEATLKLELYDMVWPMKRYSSARHVQKNYFEGWMLLKAMDYRL